MRDIEQDKYKNDYRYDKTGNNTEECVFGRIAVQQIIKNLQRRILTIVEASIAIPEQKNAIKDVMVREFNGKLDEVFELALHKSPVPVGSTDKSYSEYSTIMYLYDESSVIANDRKII